MASNVALTPPTKTSPPSRLNLPIPKPLNAKVF